MLPAGKHKDQKEKKFELLNCSHIYISTSKHSISCQIMWSSVYFKVKILTDYGSNDRIKVSKDFPQQCDRVIKICIF